MWRDDMDVPDELRFQRCQWDARFRRSLGPQHLSPDALRAIYHRGEISSLIDRFMQHARRRLESTIEEEDA